jgi:hypothetical protein
MKKLLIILLLLALGVGLWFYLLLGRDAREEKIAEEEPKTTIAEDEPAEKVPETKVSAPISPQAPPQTDVGMEFPTLEE